MDIEILAGRGFDIKNLTDPKSAFIVNEAAAREFDRDDPVGKRVLVGNI